VVDGLRDWGPRLLAPIAFFVAAIVLILLVQNALSSGGEQAAAPPPASSTSPGPTTNEGDTVNTDTTGLRQKKRYRVREGDLLETIAEEFDTSVERLVELNPGIDPQALTVGQRIRVR
jgi:LysM repeat protein